MKHEKLFGVLAITILVVTIGIAEARTNIGFWKSRPHTAGLNIQGGTNITNAIKANDYSAWQAAMSSQITQGNFNKQVQFYQHFITNHTNSTKRRGGIIQSVIIGITNVLHLNKPAMGRGIGIGMQGSNITNAIKANNYSAWQAAMNAQITQDNFNKQVQFYQQFITNHTNSTHRRGNITLWGNKTTSYTAWARHGRFHHKTT
jgi:hypothetical protein